MAKIRRYTVQEAVNTDSSGVWTTGTATTVSSSVIDTIHGTDGLDISDYHTVGITIDQPIHIQFTTTTTDSVTTAKDLRIEIGTHFIKIPQGLVDKDSEKIYLQMIRASSDSTAKIVLI